MALSIVARKAIEDKRRNQNFHNILKVISRSADDSWRDAALNSARQLGKEMNLTQEDCDQINEHLGIGYWMYPDGKWSY